jgi:PucR-like helix-turn-helix protein
MVLELSGTRSEAAAAFSAETAAVVASSLGGAIPEMIEAIGRAVPEYASPDAMGPDAMGPDAMGPDAMGPDAMGRARPGYQQRLADAVTGAVASFIAHVAQPDRSMEPVLEEFRVIGGTAAREGRTLDGLQDALRLGARVAWRWLCEAGPGLDRRELSRVGEAVFGYLDELAAACARGYAEARAQTAGDHQRHLLELILADPPPHPGQLTAAARAAHWLLPAQVAVAVLADRHPRDREPAATVPAAREPDTPLLPPGVLADWTAADPCLLIPDPDGPGRQAAVDRALHGRPATIGPSVPLAQAAQSLRWARHARALAQSGVIPDGSGPSGSGPIRCDQHLSTLLILADEALAAALSRRRLAPLDGLRPTQRDRIAETLLAWLQLGENAAEVAQRIHVHPQTVRYRLRQIQDLFGDQLRDPDCRFELQLALRIRTLTPTA